MRSCECGRPALVFASIRKKSSRRVRAGQPGLLRGHDQCLQCWCAEVNRFVAMVVLAKRVRKVR